MIGGFLGGLAGLGGVNTGINRAADLGAIAELNQLAVRQAQQNLQFQQRQQQAADLAGRFFGQQLQQPTGGQQAMGQDLTSAGIDPSSALGPSQLASSPLPAPQQFALPQAPNFGGFAAPAQQASFGTGAAPQYVDGVGPGMKSGQMPWSQFAPIMRRDESGGRNIPNYRFDPTHTASGINQITNTTWNDFAPKVGAPKLSYPASAMDRPESEQNRVGQAIYTERGAAPWANYNPQLARDLQMKAHNIGRMVSPEVGEATHGIATNALNMVDPAEYGRKQLLDTMALIEKAGPDAPPSVKFMALGMIQKIMQPADQLAFKQATAQNQLFMREMQLELQQLKVNAGLTAANVRADTAEAGLGERTRHDLAMEEIDRNKQAASAGAEKLEASKQFDVVDDKTGKVIRSGIMARERRDRAGFIDSDTGEPIKLPEGQHLRQITPSQTGGGRAQQQIQRQVTAGKEVFSNLDNAAQLPLGTTTGPFGTYAAGTTLFGALQGDLVRTLTDQNSRFMQSSMASLERELSLLESPVYGGAYASKQIEALIPKGGDTVATTLFNLARIAQIADNALESIEPSPILSNEQKEYAGQLREMLKQAIPWTPKQAMQFGAAKGPPKQTFADFVKGGGLEQSTPPPTSAPASGGLRVPGATR